MTNIINYLLAQGSTGGQGLSPDACGGQGGFSPIVFMVLIFAVFYFLFIRQSKMQKKKHKELIESLKKGDKVVSSGGIHGKITQIKDYTVKMKVDDKTEIELEKGMVRKVLK